METPTQQELTTDQTTQYLYIVQATLEPAKCKIGKTTDLDRRLAEYNSITGKSKENIYRYLFACEVSDAAAVERDIKEKFSHLREQKSREIYFYNEELFKYYVKFIREHSAFVREVPIEVAEKVKIIEKIKYSKKTSPPLKDRGMTPKDVLQKAQKIQNDEFYTRYEDVEKEINMYDKSI